VALKLKIKEMKDTSKLTEREIPTGFRPLKR